MDRINAYSIINSLQDTLSGQHGSETDSQSGRVFADILEARINAELQTINGTNSLSPQKVQLLAVILARHLGDEISTTSTWLGSYRASMPLRFTFRSPPNFDASAHATPPRTAPTVKPHIDTSSPQAKFSSLINKAASRYQLDPALITSVIKTESDFNPRAVSGAGARGLMQLMPDTANELKITDSLDPAQNIDGGSRYLARLVKRYHGDTKLALAAYNWGMGNLERQPENMPIETKNYVARIMQRWNQARAAVA